MDLNIINFTDLAYSGLNYRPIKYATKDGKDYWVGISTVKYDKRGRDYSSPPNSSRWSGDNSEIFKSIDWTEVPRGAPTSYTGGIAVNSALSEVCKVLGVTKGDYYAYVSNNNSSLTYYSVDGTGSNCRVAVDSETYKSTTKMYQIVFGIAKHEDYPDVDVVYTSSFPTGLTDTSGDCYNYGDNLLDEKSGYLGDTVKIALLDVGGSTATIGTWLPEGKSYYEHLQKLREINSGDAGNDAYTLGLRDYDIQWSILGVDDLSDWVLDYADNDNAASNFKNGGYSNA